MTAHTKVKGGEHHSRNKKRVPTDSCTVTPSQHPPRPRALFFNANEVVHIRVPADPELLIIPLFVI